MNIRIRKISAIILSVLLIAVSMVVPATAAEREEYASLIRMGGSDRYQTANAIAARGWTTAESVFLASGTSYPDALAGAPLAYALDAPILLVSGKKVNDSVMQQIIALGATKIYILGGKAAVSEEIEKELLGKNYTVERIWGQTRFETAAQISGRLGQIKGSFSEAFVVSGENYPDALSVSSVAAIKGSPIVYSNKKGTIDPNAAELIRSSGITKAYVIGGTAAIGSGITDALSACGITGTDRIFGNSRYDTSLKVAKTFVDIFKAKKVAFATGDNYPDALAGGVFAAKMGVPVLLTRAPYVAYESMVQNISEVQRADQYDEFIKELVQFIAEFGATEAYVFGGTTALPDLTIKSYFEPVEDPNEEPAVDPKKVAEDYDWKLENGVLTISGHGAMPDYESEKYLRDEEYVIIYDENDKPIIINTPALSPWYANNDTITKIIIDEGITHIGNFAFRRCSKLSSVTIPNSVKSIGEGAFSICRQLSSIIIPDGTTIIGSYAFDDCENLSSITIPESVSSIGDWAFTYCSFTSITIPDNVTYIGDGAFYGCSSLSSFTIPNGIEKISKSLFNGCSSLSSIIIPDSITSIEELAFESCALTSITLPSSVVNIGGGAFERCANLSSIIIPDSVTKIDEGAFRECISLSSITIPESITSINDTVFYGCKGLISVKMPNSIKSIGNGAFEGCSSLTSITIPNSVTSIDDSAFTLCTSLVSIEIPNSVVSIGNSAFSQCDNLSSVTIPDSVKSIGEAAFAWCSNLTAITIPDSISSISDYMFNDCNNLTSIIIPNSIINIGEKAFYNCKSLKDIYYKGTEEQWDNITIGELNYMIEEASIHFS